MLMRLIMRLITGLRTITRTFALDRRGAVAVTFAVSAVPLMVAVGAGIDLERAYTARQQLSAVAALTCQYANRPTVVTLAFGSGGSTAYIASVKSYYALALADQNASWTQTTATPFTYSQGGAGTVTLTASVPTSIMQIIGITGVPVGVSVQCFAALASTPQQPAPDATALLVNEGFENAASDPVTWYLPSGTNAPYSYRTVVNPVVSTPPTKAGYVGTNGSEWIIMGYCLEVDKQPRTANTAAEGTHSGELDCDNGSDSAGNSSISTKVYIAVGTYELRWDYASRVPNTYYGTSYVCGTTAADTSWANDTSYWSSGNNYGKRTNQINVYLDQNTTGSPPVHTTIDGTQQLAGSNLIDLCVYSYPPPTGTTAYPWGWIERSVPISVTIAGYYWLSFAADGANDSFGGLLDNIRLCPGTCPNTPYPLSDNFPATWLPTGGTNVVLFEDTFESPTYYNGSDSIGKTYNGAHYNNNGYPNLSTGSSSVWGETGQGWAMAPTNQLPYWTALCPQGNQCVELGWNANVIGGNSLVARPFLLVPGYYQVSYQFVSEVTFTTATNSYYCGATPTGAGLPTSNSSDATLRPGGGDMGTRVHDTNAVGVFMSHAQMASTPNPSTTLGSTSTYTNTALNSDGSIALNSDGTPKTTTSTTPTVPPNAINLSSYTVSKTSPLLDLCGYANSAQTRTQSVLILKTGFYWLTLAALGTVDPFGGQIDDVQIIALGSPYSTTASASSYSSSGTGRVTIPGPSPQPGDTIYYTGFSITADLH